MKISRFCQCLKTSGSFQQCFITILKITIHFFQCFKASGPFLQCFKTTIITINVFLVFQHDPAVLQCFITILIIAILFSVFQNKWANFVVIKTIIINVICFFFSVLKQVVCFCSVLKRSSLQFEISPPGAYRVDSQKKILMKQQNT